MVFYKVCLILNDKRTQLYIGKSKYVADKTYNEAVDEYRNNEDANVSMEKIVPGYGNIIYVDMKKIKGE